MRVLSRWFGMITAGSTPLFVFGDTALMASHLVMASRSYECPSSRITGSRITSRVMGQTNDGRGGGAAALQTGQNVLAVGLAPLMTITIAQSSQNRWFAQQALRYLGMDLQAVQEDIMGLVGFFINGLGTLFFKKNQTMNDMQFALFLATEGYDAFVVVFTEGILPLVYANVRLMSLTLSLMIITVIYPFHGLATCVLRGQGSCAETVFNRTARGNLSSHVLALDRTIQSVVRNVTHGAIERARGRLHFLVNATNNTFNDTLFDFGNK